MFSINLFFQCFLFQQPVVMWKMKMPEKKPLVKKDNPDEIRSNVHKSNKVKNIEPIKVLSDFQEVKHY